MSDNTMTLDASMISSEEDDAPDSYVELTRASRFTLWLPYAALAVSLALIGMGVPARIARALHRFSAKAAAVEGAERNEQTMRYEPVMFPMPSAVASAR